MYVTEYLIVQMVLMKDLIVIFLNVIKRAVIAQTDVNKRQ